MKGLPVPRLQLEWTDISSNKDWSKKECIYSLILPLRECDCRRNKDNGNDFIEDEEVLRIKIGWTIENGGGIPILDGKVDTPYRDGSHAQWDSEILGLQVWAVCAGVATRIEK